MDRIFGWVLAVGIVVALGGLWVLSQTNSHEPEPSCATDQPFDEFSDLFDASIDLNQRLPKDEPAVQGPFRRTRSESRDACVVIWTRSTSSRAMITRASVEIYLDPSDAVEAFRYAEYPDQRNAIANADRLVDNFDYYNVDLADPRPGSSWDTRHLLGCVVVRASWMADELPTNLWSPESRDDLIRRAFEGFEPVCASTAV